MQINLASLSRKTASQKTRLKGGKQLSGLGCRPDNLSPINLEFNRRLEKISLAILRYA